MNCTVDRIRRLQDFVPGNRGLGGQRGLHCIQEFSPVFTVNNAFVEFVVIPTYDFATNGVNLHMHHQREMVPSLVRVDELERPACSVPYFRFDSSLPNLHGATHKIWPRGPNTAAMVKSWICLEKRVNSAEPMETEKIVK